MSLLMSCLFIEDVSGIPPFPLASLGFGPSFPLGDLDFEEAWVASPCRLSPLCLDLYRSHWLSSLALDLCEASHLEKVGCFLPDGR